MVKIVDMTSALQQVRESDAYDNDRFIVKGGAVKKDNSDTPDSKDHVYAPNAKIAKQLHSQGKKSYKEDLNKDDEKTIKPIIKQLQKSVAAHDAQAKQLKKDISDEKDLEEGKMNQLHMYMKQGKSSKEIAKLMKLDVKTIQSLMGEELKSESLEEQKKDLEEQLKTAEKQLEELYIKEDKAYVIRFKRIKDKERMVVVFRNQNDADMYADNIKKQGGQVFSNKLEKIPYKVVDKK